jgi:hypothetical protein
MADQTEPATTPMRALPELPLLPGAATKGRTTEYLQGVGIGLHVAGYSNGAIARYLTISKPTVARHLWGGQPAPTEAATKTIKKTVLGTQSGHSRTTRRPHRDQNVTYSEPSLASLSESVWQNVSRSSL